VSRSTTSTNMQDYCGRKSNRIWTTKSFLSQNTDGAGIPWPEFIRDGEAGELFRDFSEVTFKTYFLNKRWLPLMGNYCHALWNRSLPHAGLAFVDIRD